MNDVRQPTTTTLSSTTSTTLYHLEVAINIITTTSTIKACVCPTITTTISTTSTTLNCPVCVSCPQPSNFLDEQTKRMLINLRWDKPTGSGAQWGYQIGKQDCRLCCK